MDTETDWPTVVSQSLPALAAILASAVAGLLQIWSKAGDRKHERKLKEEESKREDLRLATQQEKERIEGQRKAVQKFLHAVREQQRVALEAQGGLVEEFRELKEDSSESDIVLWERAGNLAKVGRRRILEAWEVLDSSLKEKNLRFASDEIGKALQDDRKYDNEHLFPGLLIPHSRESLDVEPLLQRLREASAELLNRREEQPEPEKQKKR